MRKIVLSIFILVFIFLFQSLTAQKVFACSNFSLSQTTLPFGFNGTLTLTSTSECFGDVDYMVLAYPSKIEGQVGDYISYAGTISKRRKDSRTIEIPIDLAFGERGKRNPGEWTVKVCQGGLVACDSKILIHIAKAFIVTDAPTPTPTPIPSNLPKISVFPSQCKYQTGSEVKILVYDVQPNTTYRWWWYGENLILGVPGTENAKYAGRTEANTMPFTFIIPSSETQQEKQGVVCVDIEGLKRCSPRGQNAQTLIFTVKPPVGEVSCTALGLIAGAPTVTLPSGTPFQPDCKGENPIDPTDLKKGYKNYKCQTAIGEINTNPAELVKQLLSIILGLSGGIALLLIIFSGYRMATAAGNPEALQGARETLTSAIVGLVFIILAIVILRIIGVEILRIPGFDS